jgi:hypothetical protein
MADEYAFYRLATVGWANSLIRSTAPVLYGEAKDGVMLDLSNLEFTDSFGLTYLAACFHIVVSSRIHGIVLRPRRDDVHKYLLDAGFYEGLGFGERFGPRNLIFLQEPVDRGSAHARIRCRPRARSSFCSATYSAAS